MKLQVDSSFDYSFPFIWTNVEITNSAQGLKVLILDLERFIEAKEVELIKSYETIITNNQEDIDQINFQIEKNKWTLDQLKLTLRNSVYVFIINQFENYLKDIYNQLKSSKKKVRLPAVYNKDRPFGERWKKKFLAFYSDDVFEYNNQGWELISILYKLRNKISHSNGVISLDLYMDLKKHELSGFSCPIDNKLNKFPIEITSVFSIEVLDRMTLFTQILMETIYNNSFKTSSNQ